MEDPNEDLKEGEEKTPTGDDQPDNKPAGSDDKEGKGASGATGPSDDQEMIPKSELEQLRKDSKEKESYRLAVIRLNKKNGRNLPGSELVKKKKVDIDEFGDKEELTEDKFVTKQELVERDEKRAVSDACKNEETLINWDDIIVFYQRPRENTYETQSVAIQNAVKLWKAGKVITDKPVEEDKKKADKAKQDLSSEKGLSAGKDKKPNTLNKRTIIPKKQNMSDWYGKEK